MSSREESSGQDVLKINAPSSTQASAEAVGSAGGSSSAGLIPEPVTPKYEPLILSHPAFSKQVGSKELVVSALSVERLLGQEHFGHGEEGVLPYLYSGFNCTKQGMNIDINNFAPWQRFPKRSTERTVSVLLHHRATTLARNRYNMTPLAVAETHLNQRKADLTCTMPSAGGAHVLLDPPWHYPAGKDHAGCGLLDNMHANWEQVVAEIKEAEEKEAEAARSGGGLPAAAAAAAAASSSTPRPTTPQFAGASPAKSSSLKQ